MLAVLVSNPGFVTGVGEGREAEGSGTFWTQNDALGVGSLGVGSVAAEQVPEAPCERTCSNWGDFVENKFGASTPTACVRIIHHT